MKRKKVQELFGPKKIAEIQTFLDQLELKLGFGKELTPREQHISNDIRQYGYGLDTHDRVYTEPACIRLYSAFKINPTRFCDTATRAKNMFRKFYRNIFSQPQSVARAG